VVGYDLLEYIQRLWQGTAAFARRSSQQQQVSRMKRYLCYISQGVDPAQQFEYQIRRAATEKEFWSICQAWLAHDAPLAARPPQHSKLFCGFSALVENAPRENAP
jgi:tRNA-dihydrouridine synthase C